MRPHRPPWRRRPPVGPDCCRSNRAARTPRARTSRHPEIGDRFIGGGGGYGGRPYRAPATAAWLMSCPAPSARGPFCPHPVIGRTPAAGYARGRRPARTPVARRPRAEPFHQHVRGVHQFEQHLQPGGTLEVDGDRAAVTGHADIGDFVPASPAPRRRSTRMTSAPRSASSMTRTAWAEATQLDDPDTASGPVTIPPPFAYRHRVCRAGAGPLPGGDRLLDAGSTAPCSPVSAA